MVSLRASHDDFERNARLRGVVAGQDTLQHVGELVHRDFCEKSERSHVHSKDGNAVGGMTGHGEEGPVAAERDQQIGLHPQLGPGHARSTVGEFVGRAKIETDLVPAAAEVGGRTGCEIQRRLRGDLRRDTDGADFAQDSDLRTCSLSMTMRSPARSGPTKRTGCSTFSMMARRERAPSFCLSAAPAISYSASWLKSSWI